jgi:hypothetical protein
VNESGKHTIEFIVAGENPTNPPFKRRNACSTSLRCLYKSLSSSKRHGSLRFFFGGTTGRKFNELAKYWVLLFKYALSINSTADRSIRPILRGRDINWYGYEFADLYLINTHNGIPSKNIPPIDINTYPAIKEHLDTYWDKIITRDDKGVSPYNLRSCAYTDDFYNRLFIKS